MLWFTYYTDTELEHRKQICIAQTHHAFNYNEKKITVIYLAKLLHILACALNFLFLCHITTKWKLILFFEIETYIQHQLQN